MVFKRELMNLRFILEKIKGRGYNGGNAWEVDDALAKLDYLIEMAPD